MILLDDLSPIEILLVEDNPADARLIVEVFNEFADKCNLNVVKDGAEAMDYLYRKGRHANMEHPSLILLDLNLPKVNGREILKTIKEDDKLKVIPVIILTTSKDENDISSSYKNHANAYITKPVDFDEFKALIYSFQDFWLDRTTLPKIDD